MSKKRVIRIAKLSFWLPYLLINLFLVVDVSAHVNLTNPTGGEIFTAGDTITIEWVLSVPHQQDNWDLYFSPDGGVTWEELQSDLDISLRSFDWIIPQIATEQAQVQINMDNPNLDYNDISDNFTIQETAVSVQNERKIIKNYSLSPNYPNPFNPSTTIEYVLPKAEKVSLAIYSLRGEEVIRLLDGFQNAGFNRVTWDASGVPSGIYFYRLQAGDFVQTRKMVLLK